MPAHGLRERPGEGEVENANTGQKTDGVFVPQR